MEPLDQLCHAMIDLYQGDPKRIQHFLKVHRFAQLIGRGEGLDEATQLPLEAAALVHDIGIHTAEARHGHCSGKLQEQLGAPLAKDLLTQLGFAPQVTQRATYLVAHHHTYTNVDGLDYQILLEADFLVNLYEDNATPETVASVVQRVFRTKTGTRLCNTVFLMNNER